MLPPAQGVAGLARTNIKQFAPSTLMRFVEFPGLWQFNPEKILKNSPPQNEAEHRLWSALCGKAVREHQAEISAEVAFLAQETDLPEAEILDVLQRWEQAGVAVPKPED